MRFAKTAPKGGTLDGETFAVVPVLASQIRRVGSREIAHARLVEA